MLSSLINNSSKYTKAFTIHKFYKDIQTIFIESKSQETNVMNLIIYYLTVGIKLYGLLLYNLILYKLIAGIMTFILMLFNLKTYNLIVVIKTFITI